MKLYTLAVLMGSDTLENLKASLAPVLAELESLTAATATIATNKGPVSVELYAGGDAKW